MNEGGNMKIFWIIILVVVGWSCDANFETCTKDLDHGTIFCLDPSNWDKEITQLTSLKSKEWWYKQTH